MTKEITKARILQEIQDKFKLRELEPEIFAFSERVVPVYNVAKHLTDMEITYTIKSVTSGPIGILFFTVPEDERWTLEGYNIVFEAAGAYTITGVYIAKFPGSANIIYLDMVAGQTVSYAKNIPIPLVLEPGSGIYIYVDGYTSTANLRLYIRYRRETIR